MRKLTFFFVVILTTQFCNAQQKSQVIKTNNEVLYITAPHYQKASIDGKVTLDQLFNQEESWKLIQKRLGAPKELIEDSTLISKSKRLKYDGIEFRYSNIPGSFQLSKVNITGNNYSLRIDDLTIFPGMSVEKLHNFLPDRFQLGSKNYVRLVIAIVDNQGQPKIKEDGNIIFSDVDFIYFNLNKDKTKVKSIEISEKLV